MTNASLNCMTTPQRGWNHKPIPWFRWGVLVVAGLLAASTAALALHSVRLEERLTTEQMRTNKITDLLVRTGSNLERLKVLEARAGASQRVVAKVMPSIVFLQGAYRFIEPASGKTLRYLGLGPDGQPLRNRFGQPFVTGIGGGFVRCRGNQWVEIAFQAIWECPLWVVFCLSGSYHLTGRS